MKNQKEIYEALLRGETLVNDDGYEAYMDGHGRLNSTWAFSVPENWSIKPKGRGRIELFWTLDNFGSKCLCNINGKYPYFKDKKFCGLDDYNEMRKKNILKNEPSIFIDAETFERIQ